MKKSLRCLIFLAFLLVCLSACGESGTPTATTAPMTAVTSATSGAAASVTAPATAMTPATAVPSTTEVPSSHSHVFGGWQTVTPADCTRDGLIKRACACGYTEERKMLRSSHEYKDGACLACGAPDPDYVPQIPNTVGAAGGASVLAVQGDWLYFAPTYYELARLRIDGDEGELLYEVSTGRILNINVVGEWVYFYCEGDTAEKSYIARVGTDGTGFEKLVSGTYVGELLVVGDALYFTALKSPYRDFGKDVYPLYRVSTSGGLAVQLHDGAVRELAATKDYLYFVYENEEGATAISCIRHGRTNSTTLFSGKEIGGLSIDGERLYFWQVERVYTVKYESEFLFSSIPILGGAKTLHTTVPYHGEFFCAIGGTVYYDGSPFDVEEEEREEYGLCAYDVAKDGFRLIARATDEQDFYGYAYHAAGPFLVRLYYENEEFSHIVIFDGNE